MADPPPDSITDDFFDQLFSMPTPYVGTDSTMPLHLASGDPPAAAGEGFPPSPVFPLGLSLESSATGERLRDEAATARAAERDPLQLTSFFPAFGQQHQIRQNPQPQVFHGQVTQGGAATAAAQPLAPRPRVRARRGQATDPHSIAERLRRERIAERLRALQELVPNTNKTDKAAMLDEILDYVKFLRLQVKVLSMSRLGGTGAVAQLVSDIPLSSLEGNGLDNDNKQQVWEKWSVDGTERQVAKFMEEDVGAAMQFLQSKSLCMMPISLATAIYQTHQQAESPSVKPEPNTP